MKKNKSKILADFLVIETIKRGIDLSYIDDYVREILSRKNLEKVTYDGVWSIEDQNAYEVIIDEDTLDFIAKETKHA